MVRKALPAIIVALFLIASAAPFITTFNSTEQDLAGDPPTSFDPSWIPISTPQELALMGSGGEYPVNGKYYLTNDIDFTASEGVDLNGGFDITVSVSIGVPTANMVMVALYHSGTTTGVTSTNNILVSLNGVIYIVTPSTSGTYFAFFDITSDLLDDLSVLEVVAGGVTNNAPSGVGDSNFAVAAVFTPAAGETELSKVVKSNGNMNMLTPITGFSGTFDGNGKKIIGLEISSYGAAYAGLFGSLTSPSSFNNIALEGGSTVSVAAATTVYAGGLAGRSDNGATIKDSYNTNDVTSISLGITYAAGLIGNSGPMTIRDSYNAGDVRAFSTSSNTIAAGLVGSSGSTTITDSYNEGTISSDTGGTSTSYSAGLIGQASSLTVTDSYNIGAVSAKTTVGGLLSNTSGSLNVERCYNEGSVSASLIKGSAGSIVAGGLIGNSSITTITDSHNDGDVSTSGSASGTVAAGGLAGTPNVSTIKRCYSTGEITSGAAGGLLGVTGNGGRTNIEDSYTTGNVKGVSQAGGLIGELKGSGSGDPSKITKSYTTGDIMTLGGSSVGFKYAGGLIGGSNAPIEVTSCYTTGEIKATGAEVMHAGGLMGYTYQNLSVTIMLCFTTGDVTASTTRTESSTTSYANAGGLIGTNRGNTTIMNAYVRGDVSTTASSTAYETHTGGIIGQILTQSSSATILTNCYVTGEITSTSNRGGIVGNAIEGRTYIINCYFLEETGLDIYGGTSVPTIDGIEGGGRLNEPSGGLTEADLKDEVSYHDSSIGNMTMVGSTPYFGWDFNNIWDIDYTEVINNGYPFFRWAIFTEHPVDIHVNIIPDSKFSISTYFVSADLQWQKSTDGITWNDITGADKLDYITTASDNFGDMFRCLVGPTPSNSAMILGFDLTINITGTGELQYGGGDISSNTVINNVPTKEIEFTVDAGEGYRLDSITLGGTDITDTVDEENKFIVDTTASRTLTVIFALLPQYTITVEVNDTLGGSVSPDSEGSVTHGNDHDITVTETMGYWSDFFLDGIHSSEWENGTYDTNDLGGGIVILTLKNVTADHVVSVIFEKVSFDVVAFVRDGEGQGDITPKGHTAKYGDNVPFTITSNPGYRISYVEVGDDGSVYGEDPGRLIDISTEIDDDGVYILADIKGLYWIAVGFEEMPDVVTTSVRSGNGTITPAGSTEITSEDKMVTIEITPDVGWTIYQLYINDEISYQWYSGNTFQLTILEDTLVEVVFVDRFTINASVDGIGGTISPSGKVEVLLGADKEFTFLPAKGYSIERILVENEDVEVASEYLFENVDRHHSIVVIFAALEYGVYVEGYDEAKVEFTLDPLPVTIEDVLTLTLTPFEGYDVTVIGVDVGTLTYNDSDGCWEITDIDAECTITISIVPLVYYITVDDDYDDTIVTLVDVSATEVTIETTVSVILTVIEGHSAKITVDAGTLMYNDSDDAWVITGINANCTITLLIDVPEEPGSGINLMWIVIAIVIAAVAGIVVYVSRKNK